MGVWLSSLLPPFFFRPPLPTLPSLSLSSSSSSSFQSLQEDNILLAAISRVDPQLALLVHLSQNLPAHSALRRVMEDELKRRRRAMDDYEGEESDDSEGRIVRREEETTDYEGDEDYVCDWEEDMEEETYTPTHARPLDTSYTYRVTDQEGYQRVLADTRSRCLGWRERERSGEGGQWNADCITTTDALPTPLLRRTLELGASRSGRLTRRVPAALGAAQYAAMVNKFLPRYRHSIAHIRSKIFCCQYLPNQRQVAIGSQDEEIRFFARRNEAYELERSIRVPYSSWSILDLAFSPDGQLVCYSTWNDAVFVGKLEGEDSLGGWRRKDMPEEERGRAGVQQHVNGAGWTSIHVAPRDAATDRMAIFCVRFSHDGREILCGGADDRVHVLDVERSHRILALTGHEDDINAVSYGDFDANLILTAGDDGLCKVWDRRVLDASGELQPVGTFAGHCDGITYIDTRGDGRTILTNSKDQTIKIWDLRHFSSSAAVNNTRTAVSRQAWDYRWQTCPMASKRMKALEGDTSLATLRGHSVLHTLVRARWSPERTGRRFIYTGCARGNVILFDTLELRPMCCLPGHRAVVRDCLWTDDDNEIFTSAWDGNLAVWRWDEGNNTCERRTAEGPFGIRGTRTSTRLTMRKRRRESAD